MILHGEKSAEFSDSGNVRDDGHQDSLNNSPLKREGFLGTRTDFSFRSF
jgi:hypothetical protein